MSLFRLVLDVLIEMRVHQTLERVSVFLASVMGKYGRSVYEEWICDLLLERDKPTLKA